MLLTQPEYAVSCFTSVLAFAFALYNALSPDPCAEIIGIIEVEPDYDFVIIGGGSAGNVIANRLSEISDWKILLLEAGGPETDMTDVPYLLYSFQNTEFDWQYLTEPPKPSAGQRYCLAMSNHSCRWPRGKVLGGTSVLNGMMYVRGNKRDYDNWEAAGNEGWGYKDVLPYFLKSENQTNATYLQSEHHSCGGYLDVADLRYYTPLADAFLQAGEYLGYYSLDVNAENHTGFTIPQVTQRDGRRCSTSKAFIRTSQHRPNLNISMNSTVTRIGFKDDNGTPRATTVYFVKGNKNYSITAKKEVVLCAGAINSPQLLMLSGIGPKKHLKKLGIKLVKDLKVGYNLQDHVYTGNMVFQVDKPVTFNLTFAQTPEAVFEYVKDGQGPLTSIVNIEAHAFVNSKYADPSGTFPDIQYLFLSSSLYTQDNPSLIGEDTFNFVPDIFNGTDYLLLKDKFTFQIFPLVLHPKSTGRVMLRSADPFEHPIIIPNYYIEQADMDIMIDAMRIIFKLCETPPFKAYNATPLLTPFPGCEKHQVFTDEYLECLARHYTMTTYHPSCTCAMGVGPDAVVDPRLRVYGVKGLRVVDCSVMPNVTSGNTNVPAIMLGEKGSDMIKEDWGVCIEPLSSYPNKCNCSKPITC